MQDASGLDGMGEDHVGFAHVGFLGDVDCVRVQFRTRRQLDELIRLLTDLRDDPEAQRDHVHLQDVSHRKAQRWTREYREDSEVPPGVEIVFWSPRYRCTDTERALLRQGRASRHRRR